MRVWARYIYIYIDIHKYIYLYICIYIYHPALWIPPLSLKRALRCTPEEEPGLGFMVWGLGLRV